LADLEVDVVVDVSGEPGWVATAVAAWPAAYWVFISTINVYSDLAVAGGAENTPTVAPWREGEASDYGAEKVACENLVLSGTASALILRPGLIVGSDDPSGRFTYWPIHAAEADRDGGGLLIPGAPDDLVQLIDVGDLADWVVRAAEARQAGVFDAVCPPMTRAEFVAELLAGVRSQDPTPSVAEDQTGQSGSGIKPVWVPSAELLDLGIAEWMGPRAIPLWIADPSASGLMARDVTTSLAAGLIARPLAQTVRQTLQWAETTPDPPVTGLTRDEERALLDARQS
jgi:nucleoside-diphosphate-sugar epimerase